MSDLFSSAPFSASASSSSRPRLPPTTDPPSATSLPAPKVWLIFGATGHIGRSLVKAALAHNDQVTAVGRTGENSLQQMHGWHESCLGLLCDVRVPETVEDVIQQSIQRWGRVDIITNCTGYGVIGACEDQDDWDLRSQFETNFMGMLNIIQLSLPYFRQQSSVRREGENAGRYIIFSSTAGAFGIPGLGPYCAMKFATEGLIESMLYEVDTFGIKATLVEPGHMRLDEPTDDTESHAASVSAPDHPIQLRKHGHFFVKPASAPYDTATAPAGHARRIVQWLTDRQPTSAVRSAELVWQLGHCRYPPLRLLLGLYAVESVRDRLRGIIEETEDWKDMQFGAQGDAVSKGEDDNAADGTADRMLVDDGLMDSGNDHDPEDQDEDF